MITSFDVNHSWDVAKGKVIFSTLRDYTFESRGKSITVPSGFTTDFASVPRGLWPLLPPLGKHSPAALVHDYLYDHRIGTRKEADKIFLDLMLKYSVPKWRAYVMYWGVRIGGKSWWTN